jgi:hypothetical protein
MSVPRYEFVSDVEPKADKPDMGSDGNISIQTGVSRYQFVNDVDTSSTSELDMSSEPDIYGVSCIELALFFSDTQNDVVTDVEKPSGWIMRITHLTFELNSVIWMCIESVKSAMRALQRYLDKLNYWPTGAPNKSFNPTPERRSSLWLGWLNSCASLSISKVAQGPALQAGATVRPT